jgi:hypothetical protein
MTCVEYVVQISETAINIPNCLYMLPISRVKPSTCLPNVFHLAVHAFHLVNAAFLRNYLFVNEFLCFVFGKLF